MKYPITFLKLVDWIWPETYQSLERFSTLLFILEALKHELFN